MNRREYQVEVADVVDVICELEQCATEDDANSLTMQVVRQLGADWFVYATLLPPELNKADESFHYFIGCREELCDIYRQRMWKMNDPFLEYALSNSAPILGSKVKLATPGQAEILRTGADLGFRSGLVVPTHTSMGNKRLGLLYIGSELPPQDGEPMLWQRRGQFVALGHELLQWWNTRLRHQAMRKYSLVKEEIEILQLVRKGKVASEIAAIYDVKVSAIYRKWESLKEKLDVEKIEHAVIVAESIGLLE
jgi:DNA-binding CsgD family transcriptional regulator